MFSRAVLHAEQSPGPCADLRKRLVVAIAQHACDRSSRAKGASRYACYIDHSNLLRRPGHRQEPRNQTAPTAPTTPTAPTAPTTARPNGQCCPAPSGSKSVILGLGVDTELPEPSSNPPVFEQSYFDVDDDDHDENIQACREKTGRVKSWFPPRPFRSRADKLPSPRGDAQTRRVLSQGPQIVQSASRLSRRLSHLRWPLSKARIEVAEVPIVSTSRDLRIDLLSSPSRTLASPFQYDPQLFSDKRDTIIGPSGRQHRGSHDHPHLSRGFLVRQDSEQSNVI